MKEQKIFRYEEIEGNEKLSWLFNGYILPPNNDWTMNSRVKSNLKKITEFVYVCLNIISWMWDRIEDHNQSHFKESDRNIRIKNSNECTIFYFNMLALFLYKFLTYKILKHTTSWENNNLCLSINYLPFYCCNISVINVCSNCWNQY